MFRLLARENGFIHVCGHRGHSIGAPENTLAALTATRDNGGTCAEIDCMLTNDGEIVLMHDDFLDRTTDGSGLVSRRMLGDVRRLDAGLWFGPAFAGERVPTLIEALEHARGIGLGLVVEVKEFLRPECFVARLAQIAVSADFRDNAIYISFDHVFLKELKERLPKVRTEGITHARHADVVGLARAANLDSVSIEHLMFRPEDGEALHRAGIAVRFHVERPDHYARYVSNGVDLFADVRSWLERGVIDIVSGDDVVQLARLVQGVRMIEAAQA